MSIKRLASIKGATVAAEMPMITTMEADVDTSVSICVELRDIMSGLDRSVDINLVTTAGTAGELYSIVSNSSNNEMPVRF